MSACPPPFSDGFPFIAGVSSSQSAIIIFYTQYPFPAFLPTTPPPEQNTHVPFLRATFHPRPSSVTHTRHLNNHRLSRSSVSTVIYFAVHEPWLNICSKSPRGFYNFKILETHSARPTEMDTRMGWSGHCL